MGALNQPSHKKCLTFGGISNGLIQIRSVRMYMGVRISSFYAYSFEGLGPKKVGIMDLRHAICSTAAEIFVIEDHTIEEKVLQRIPIDNHKIVKLRDFLEIISQI